MEGFCTTRLKAQPRGGGTRLCRSAGGQRGLHEGHLHGIQALEAWLLPDDAETEAAWDFSIKVLPLSKKISLQEDCRLGQSINSTFFKTSI